MSKLDNDGLKNTYTNKLIVDVNNTYFPDNSYNFYATKFNVISTTDSSYNKILRTIPPGIWQANVSVQFTNSPICSVGIYTDAIGSGYYGTLNSTYDFGQGRITPPTSSSSYANYMVSWNAVSGFDAGSTNGCSTSCTIAVPSIQEQANVGISIFNQSNASMNIYFTIARIGPEISVSSYSV